MTVRQWTSGLCAVLLLASTAATAGGRPGSAGETWFGHINGGWAMPQGDLSNIADDAFSFGGGVTYWPSNRSIGLQLDINYTYHDISSSAIRAINDAINDIDPNIGSVTGGDITDWSFMLNGIWSPGGASSEGFYLTGGIGLSAIEGRLKDTGLVYYPPICDPWWWWCYPGGVGPGNFVVAKESTTEFAWNVGAGYSFQLRGGSILFFEAKYKAIETSERSEIVPLTFGIRW